MWRTDRVLITGAAGALGSCLFDHWSARGGCFGVSRRPLDCSSQHTHCDLTDRPASIALLERVRPTLIINAAALADVDQCERTPLEAFESNVRIVSHLVDWIRRQIEPVGLVQISTDQVYSGCGPHREDEDVRPANIYGLTKQQGEEVALQVPQSLVIRTNFVHLHGRSGGGFARWLIDGLEMPDEALPLFGDVFFSPLYVGQVVDHITEIVAQGMKGVFNLGSSGAGISKHDFGILVSGGLGGGQSGIVRTSIADIPRVAARPRDMTMDSSRLERLLGRAQPAQEEVVKQLLCAFEARKAVS